MSLLDNVMQTLSGTAQTVVDRGQQIGNIASLQIILKKLQLERAKQMHDLGRLTHARHKAGILGGASGVHEDMIALCLQIDDTNRDIDATQAQIDAERQRLEAARLQAEVDRMKASEARHETSTNPPLVDVEVPPANHTGAPR